MKAPCLHCGKLAQVRARGLCCTCYKRPDVRMTYPVYAEDTEPEPTAEEVERTIAEQSRCLPAWWGADLERMARERRGLTGGAA